MFHYNKNQYEYTQRFNFKYFHYEYMIKYLKNLVTEKNIL